jgi:CspA family cold shock protein
MRGTVVWFDDRKGYGFIKLEGRGTKDIFVHYSNLCMEGYKRLNTGDHVEFELGENKTGPQAIEVKVL